MIQNYHFLHYRKEQIKKFKGYFLAIILEEGKSEEISSFIKKHQLKLKEALKYSPLLSTRTKNLVKLISNKKKGKHGGRLTLKRFEYPLDETTITVLKTVGPILSASNFYLTASAAIALYLKHRKITHLDFMSFKNKLTSPQRRILLEEIKKKDDSVKVIDAYNGYMLAIIKGTVKLRINYFPYPLVNPPNIYFDTQVASIADLTLTKAAALVSRLDSRDFIDLFFLDNKIRVTEILPLWNEKFPHLVDFPFQLAKALASVDIAANTPIPNTLENIEWSVIERWAKKLALEISSDILKLGEEG